MGFLSNQTCIHHTIDAANDAYSALLIYKYLVKMANDNHVELNPDLHTLDVKKPQKKIHVTR